MILLRFSPRSSLDALISFLCFSRARPVAAVFVCLCQTRPCLRGITCSCLNIYYIEMILCANGRRGVPRQLLVILVQFHFRVSPNFSLIFVAASFGRTFFELHSVTESGIESWFVQFVSFGCGASYFIHSIVWRLFTHFAISAGPDARPRTRLLNRTI